MFVFITCYHCKPLLSNYLLLQCRNQKHSLNIASHFTALCGANNKIMESHLFRRTIHLSAIWHDYPELLVGPIK